jgi:hypothetical protein
LKPLNLSAEVQSLTCLSYGTTGAGKTEFAATWPNPVFFSAAAENGHKTVQYMDPSKWYDPKWPLLEKIYPVKSVDDFKLIVPIAKEEIKKGAKTLVYDSATFLVNMLVNGINQRGFDLWGEVLAKMTALRTESHSLGVHVVWTSAVDLATKNLEIQGQTAVALPHCCDLLLYHTAEEDPTTKKTLFRAWTSPKAGFPARHRFGNKILSPLGRLEPAPDGNGRILIPEVSYRAIETALRASA